MDGSSSGCLSTVHCAALHVVLLLQHALRSALPLPPTACVSTVPPPDARTHAPTDPILVGAQAVDFVRERLQAGRAPREVAEDLCDRCLAPDTGGCGKGCDNMSVIVVQLKYFCKS